MNDFLERHQLPQPSTVDLAFRTSSALFLCSSEGEHKFEVGSEIGCTSSAMIRALVEDSDASAPVVLPIGADCASPLAVSIVASWLSTSSPLEPKPSDVVPKVNVVDTPGTTGLRGRKIIEASLRDPWSIKVLEAVFPLELRAIKVPRSDVFFNAPGESTLQVAVGIRGLQLLYQVTQLAGFLGMPKLMELCGSHILNGLQHCLRDERAFGVAQRLDASAPRGSDDATSSSPHIAVTIVTRSLALSPAKWDPAIPYELQQQSTAAAANLTDTTMIDMVKWLRDTATGASL
ncbi:Hypothetical protein, putative [Bodo saltans]|uniref:Uncharacterized protein n=1 Tax=Bodo saltans TaxID=75058 RepID=A0A0S4IT27_BODSA|nr:Hypothetical protein, putative [Bodo saltans]|eukprot:CUF69624.1 Hypothetical protein, putative [Bodo saltans]